MKVIFFFRFVPLVVWARALRYITDIFNANVVKGCQIQLVFGTNFSFLKPLNAYSQVNMSKYIVIVKCRRHFLGSRCRSHMSPPSPPELRDCSLYIHSQRKVLLIFSHDEDSSQNHLRLMGTINSLFRADMSACQGCGCGLEFIQRARWPPLEIYCTEVCFNIRSRVKIQNFRIMWILYSLDWYILL